MIERTQAFISLFQWDGDGPKARVTFYGDKIDQQATELRIAGHVISVHGLYPEQLNKLADDLCDCARKIEERISKKTVESTSS